ncbi:MAG: cation-translocating P-type ATPase, partial [Candidatus Gallimonas sp.]
LAVGVQRLARRNAIIRRLPAVETLGGASVICSDKTGTLTQNRMTLVCARLADGTEEEIGERNGEGVRALLKLATLCTEGSVLVTERGEEQHIGDPTETSIVAAALHNGIEKEELSRACPRVGSIPFDSDRKLMTAVHEMQGKRIAIVKGAFDSVKDRLIGSDPAAEQCCADWSSRAIRVLAVATKELGENEPRESWESGLTLAGLVGMIDPPRPEAREAVEKCRAAGIRPVMITGDSLATASAIAKDLKILREGDQAILGTEVDAMSEEELRERVDKVSVYARVSPENKIAIVKAWQARGEVVAMTGDGVNDAPALKAADIGCAMGVTGTDVAKGAADMTLSDDNFSTIVSAVEEGRGIYANVRKVVGFLLGTNIGEILLVFAAMLISRVSPLVSIQLLWINLVSDGLPAVALGLDGVDSSLMRQRPKRKDESLFANGYLFYILFQGATFGGISLAAYYLGAAWDGGVRAGQTLAFLVFAVAKLIQAYHLRSDRSIFRTGLSGNRRLNYATLLSLALTLFVAFVPGVREVFRFTILSPRTYLVGIALVLVPSVLTEAYKLLARLIRKRKN